MPGPIRGRNNNLASGCVQSLEWVVLVSTSDESLPAARGVIPVEEVCRHATVWNSVSHGWTDGVICA